MSFEMSLNISFIGYLFLVSVSAQQIGVSPASNGTTKEIIYDINLYITVPASVVALGLLICLFYCLVCACREPEPQGLRAFQPVIVTNRSSPLVISSQNTSHNETVVDTNVSSGTNQRNNAQRPQKNQSFLDRIWNRKSDNTVQSTAPKSGIPGKQAPAKANSDQSLKTTSKKAKPSSHQSENQEKSEDVEMSVDPQTVQDGYSG